MSRLSSRRIAFSEPDEYHCAPSTSSSSSYSSPSPAAFAQRAEDVGKPTLVLDMDETLLHSEELKSPVHASPHSQFYDASANNTFAVYFADGTGVKVSPRPYLMEFLLAAKQIYELVIFTAGSEEYANLVLDRLDPTRTLFSHRLYRQHCQYVVAPNLQSFGFLKDLQILNRDLRRTICVDNMIHFVKQIENGIPIPSYFDNAQDFALRNLLFLLRALEHSCDVRHDLAEMAKLFQSQQQQLCTV